MRLASGCYRIADNSRLTKHVVAAGGSVRDAGSTPAASTIFYGTIRGSTVACEQFFQPMAKVAAHVQARAVLENDRVIAIKHRLQFLDAIHIHNRRAADANEAVGRQLCFHSTDGLAQLMRDTADVHSHIISVRFDPLDVPDTNEDDPAVRFEGETLGFPRVR